MGKILDYFLGREYTLEEKEKKKLKVAERKAYVVALRKSRIVRAKKIGQQKGAQKPKSPLGTIGSMLEGGMAGAKSYIDMFDLGLEPKRRKAIKKKKRPSRGTTIRIDGTTITIGTKRKKKK